METNQSLITSPAIGGGKYNAKPVVELIIPMRLVSELNRHEHWRYRQRRAKQQHTTVTLYLMMKKDSIKQISMPYVITLTRVGPRKMDKGNNAGALKHVEDAVAKFLGIDDGDETAAMWNYDQEKGAYAVRIRIEAGKKAESHAVSAVYTDPDREERNKFESLAEEWERKTQNVSSDVHSAIHPAYQKIIAMGPRAIPLILERMEQQGGRWFWALSHLTGENPVPARDTGKIRRMQKAWLKWGKSCGYVTRSSKC